MRRMPVGHIVDFVVDYNDREKRREKENEKPKRRKATQADINSFFGA